jgi:hypothetical protein
MPYSYTNTMPATSPPLPPALGVTKLDQIKTLVTAIHGPDTGEALIRYSLNLKNAVDLSREIEQRGCEAGADPTLTGQPWTALEAEIQSAVVSYRAAAEAAADLTGTTACTPALLSTIPAALLGRILAAGLACEADALEDLICALPAPAPESTTSSPG